MGFKKLLLTTLSLVIMLIILTLLLDNPFLSGIIVLIFYFSIVIIRVISIKRLLEEKCDPQSFLDAIEKQKGLIFKKSMYNTQININIAAGLIALGHFDKAKEILLNCNMSHLIKNNGIYFAYYINLITCLFELGEVTYADELFLKHILNFPTSNSRIKLAKKLLEADRLFHLSKFDESKILYENLLKNKMSKMDRLYSQYKISQIYEINGDLVTSKKKYKLVLDNGNKLWIAKQSQDKIEKLFR